MAFREKYGFTKTLRKNLRVLRLQLRRRREINDSCAFHKMVQYLQNRVLWTTRKMSKPIYKVLKIPGVVANTKDVGTTGSMVSHFNDFMAAAESLEFDSCWQKRNRSWVLCYFSDFLGSSGKKPFSDLSYNKACWCIFLYLSMSIRQLED